MRYDEMTPTLMTADKLDDGYVVARGEYDPKSREITLKGKGAPREWRAGDIVTTDKMVAFSRDQYVTDGTVIVVGKVREPKPTAATAANVARVAESGRDPKPKTRRGGRTCNVCGRNLSPNPKAQHKCEGAPTPIDANPTTDAENVHADYEALRALILSADLTSSHRWALVRLLAQ